MQILSKKDSTPKKKEEVDFQSPTKQNPPTHPLNLPPQPSIPQSKNRIPHKRPQQPPHAPTPKPTQQQHHDGIQTEKAEVLELEMRVDDVGGEDGGGGEGAGEGGEKGVAPAEMAEGEEGVPGELVWGGGGCGWGLLLRGWGG